MRKSDSLRLVIDTNLWISFLISDKERKLDRILAYDNLKILFNEELLNEISTTVKYPKLKKFFSETAVDEMLMQLSPVIEIIKTSSFVDVCRDKRDNFLLSICMDGNADFLLTGDKDLLILRTFGKTKITSITDFIEQLTTSL